MKNNRDFATRTSTALAGFTLAAYGLAFFVNALHWL